jgi:pSer/pThr/pTyr-binding forkhead associated (FHA) protein
MQFTARYPGSYFVAAEEGHLESGFSTAVLDMTAAPKKDNQPEILEVFALQKAPGNPYSDRISVGRAKNCDVVVRDSSVSKLHAHLRPTSDGNFEVVDLGSQNGTSVNGRALPANKSERVFVGDTLRFGAIDLLLVDGPALYELLRR